VAESIFQFLDSDRFHGPNVALRRYRVNRKTGAAGSVLQFVGGLGERESRGSKDILGFGQNPRPDERRERLRGHELHPSSEALLEQVGQVQEAIERLRARRKLYEEVDVAVGPSLIPQD